MAILGFVYEDMTEVFELLELNRLLEVCAREAVSELGKKRVLASTPLQDVASVRRELSLVDEMSRLLGQTSLPIEGISDISSSLKKLAPAGGMLDRDEYLPLSAVLSASGRIARFIAEQEEDFPGLETLAEQLGNFDGISRSIERVFDSSGEIRDDASPELRRIRRRKDAEARKLHETLERIHKQWHKQGLTQEDTPAFREGKVLIPVKSEHRGRVAGVIADESATGATIFVEPLEAIAIGNAIRSLENEERREIYRLLQELCGKIRDRLAEITHSLEILAKFDHIYARARFGRRLNCQMPLVTEKPFIKLIGARHPLLTLREGTEVVPLTLTLGDSQGSILIITGPNAGGKTVALKTVGLLCLMASCGLLVPAEEGTELPVLSSLHCDIGDPQSLEQDLSTFTSHLLRLKNALADEAFPKLVLLDEIGSGTDPGEGSAIARAALLELRRQGALVIATTHQGTLKVFAHETDGIFNGSMEFDSKTLRPTFHFRPGIPGSSYALEISARVGLSKEILSAAKDLLGEQTSRMEDLLSRLNESLRLSEEARREADLKRTELEALRKLYSDRLNELKKSEKERLRKAARDAKEILRDANRRIEAAVKTIREEQASKESIHKAHRVVKDEKLRIQKVLEEEEAKEGAKQRQGWSVKKDDWVQIEGLRDPVRVLAVRKDGFEAKLEVGGVHLWMSSEKLSPARAPRKAEPKADISISMSEGTQTIRPEFELDLRGMTGDEAEFALEKYLSDCAVSGWKTVRIIHGKGTGVLQQRVREMLKKYPGVKSFRYGRPEEGDFGVTVVELE